MQTLLLVTLLMGAGPRMVEDDYPAALAQARAQKKLLFVDAWAPWCHTCVFMREHVFTRPVFASFEKDVVFASVDTEKAGSAAFLEKYPVDVWPTLFFIDPVSGKVLLKWIGSADEAQMTALLAAARGGGEADALLAAGKTEEAAQRYLKTLPEKGAEARATLSTLSALYMSKKMEPCMRTALAQLPTLQAPGDRLNGVLWGLWCANEAADFKDKAALTASLVKESHSALKLEGVLADDRSSLLEAMVEERTAAKDDAAALALAQQWLTWLDTVAAQAGTPAARAVFDSHRVAAALAARKPQVMVAPLQQSEKEMPEDYNPPARLALIYRELGQHDDALAAADRALQRCKQGPRKLRIYDTKASILAKKGDTAGRKKVLQEALAYARTLPRAQLPASRIAALEKQLATP